MATFAATLLPNVQPCVGPPRAVAHSMFSFRLSQREDRAAEAAHEAELLRRVAAGDQDAPLEELYDRYERRVWAIGLRRLRDRELAADLVQETFVRLWRAAARFDADRGTVGALITTIAQRAAIDMSRRRAGQADVVSLDLEYNDPPADEDGESVAERVAVADALQEGLGALSADHREVLRLHIQEDLPQAEVAERLGLPVGTVKSRLHYALRELRQTLTAMERDHG